MSEGFKKDDDLKSDHWLSAWEQKTAEAWDSDSSAEEKVSNENDRCKQKLWSSFQSSASSISQLYKGRYACVCFLSISSCLTRLKKSLRPEDTDLKFKS